MSCWGSNPVFCFEWGVREGGRGEWGSWTVSTAWPPAVLYLVSQTRELSAWVDFRGPWKIAHNHPLPPLLSPSGFGVTWPPFYDNLCLLPSLYLQMEISQSPPVFRCQVRSALPTSRGCYGSNGHNRHMFLLPEKSESFVILIIIVWVITTDKVWITLYVIHYPSTWHRFTDLILKNLKLGDEVAFIIPHVTEEEPELHK